MHLFVDILDPLEAEFDLFAAGRLCIMDTKIPPCHHVGGAIYRRKTILLLFWTRFYWYVDPPGKRTKAVL